MCRMGVIYAMVRLLLLVACLTLSLFMPNALVGIGIWFFVWLLWERVPEDERLTARSAIELLPFAIAGQVALDSVVPYLGDVVAVVGNAMIVAALRRPKLPRAQIHTTTIASRRARVRRVISSRVERAAAPAASACGGARRAS